MRTVAIIFNYLHQDQIVIGLVLYLLSTFIPDFIVTVISQIYIEFYIFIKTRRNLQMI